MTPDMHSFHRRELTDLDNPYTHGPNAGETPRTLLQAAWLRHGTPLGICIDCGSEVPTERVFCAFCPAGRVPGSRFSTVQAVGAGQ